MPFSALLLVVAPAWAHPGMSAGRSDPNGGMPGQRVEVSVGPGELRVDYYAEIAAIRLYKEARAEQAAGPTWAAGKAEALRTGLRVSQGGVDLPLTPVSVEKPAQIKETAFVELHLAATTPLHAEAGELTVRMENFPEEPCYYAASVNVDGAWVVVDTNLGHVKGGRLRDNQHGAWRRDDAARIATFTLRPTHPWEDHTPGPLPERLEGLVGVDGQVAGGAAALAGFGVVAAGAAGLRAWRRGRR